MLDLLLLIVFVTFWIYITIYAIHSKLVRTRADKIIAGKQQANTTELNRYIARLTGKGAYPIGRSEQDRQRIEQLRNIRNDLTKKHN